MGEIIHKINSGGVRGLCDMGFLDEIKVPSGKKKAVYELGAVQDAFNRYYDWILATTSEAERAHWKWNVVTAENHLCKHHCLLDHISAL